jgi:nicotinamidase-related amidase
MSNTALLVMDVQKGIATRVQDPAYLSRLSEAADAARNSGIRVLHVVVGFRVGHPEISTKNAAFSGLPPEGFTENDPGAAIQPELAPAPGETIITKKRVSAFAGSDLELVLRGGEIDHLVLTGIATSGVVLSTLRQAADLDYRLTVLADGCYDPEPQVHDVLTNLVFPKQAQVTTIAEWTKSLGQ